jgi:hypothetical protein
MIRQKTIFSQSPSPRLCERRPPAALRFTPTAWAKLLFLRDAGETEVGGFGISNADDLLLIENVQLVRQVCDLASVLLDDSSVADYFDRQVDAGVHVARCGRVWLHTHPGDSPAPSSTDEETFARVFGHTEWALMFILARGGRTYARLRFHVGPGGDIELPVNVDYSQPFAASDHEAWLAEYEANVDFPQMIPLAPSEPTALRDPYDDDWLIGWDRPFDEVGFTDRKEQSHAI